MRPLIRLTTWRGFSAEIVISNVTAKGALTRLNKIEKHGHKDWHALGWMLERRYPEHFARAETQLTVTAQAGVINGNGNGAGQNAEMIIVSDLEFVGLQRHPAYRHEPDVHALDQVPTEVSGSLKREGQNIVVISESKVAARKARFVEVRAKTREMFEAHGQSPDRHTNQAATDAIAPEASDSA